MRDINKYRRIYHLLISPLVFILFWYVICEINVNRISISFMKYHIVAGSSLLFISLILKRLNNIITIALIGFVGISLLILIFGDNIVFGFAFYSLSFSILSVDAIYSQSDLKKKILMFLITLFVFSSLLTIINSIFDSGKSNISNIIEQKTKISENKEAKQDSPIPNKDSSLAKRFDSLKTNTESIKETLSMIKKESVKREVNSFINDWKTAWESRNIKKYKSFYSDDLISTDKDGKEYKYSEKMSTAEKNFKNYSYIKINFENTIYEFDDEFPNEVTVKMRQKYSSDKYSDYGLKTLMIFKGKSTNNKWKIYREKFEILKEVKQQRQPVEVKKDEETSFFGKLCYGTIILIIIVIIISIIRKVFY
jgi:ketosteroid isomerase-like protein